MYHPSSVVENSVTAVVVITLVVATILCLDNLLSTCQLASECDKFASLLHVVSLSTTSGQCSTC